MTKYKEVCGCGGDACSHRKPKAKPKAQNVGRPLTVAQMCKKYGLTKREMAEISAWVNHFKDMERLCKGLDQEVYAHRRAEPKRRAALIRAAAPDLLAALKDAEEFVHGWMEQNTGERELAALERIEAAIAKAEGR